MARVLLVDDHPVVRQGLARVLTAEIPDIEIEDAVDGRTAVERLRASRFDLVLLDLQMPGDSGLTLLRKLRREFAAIPILVVSMHPVDQFAPRALQAGAVGYVAKDSDPAELVAAVRSALAGASTCRRKCRRPRASRWSARRTRRSPIGSTRSCA